MRQSEFANGVMDTYRRLGQEPLVKSLTEVRAYGAAAPSALTSPPVGHPEFAALAIGESAYCRLAIGFVDMRAMTARSFWQPLEEVTRLSLAVLTQVAEIVESSGGHVLGLRGDGLMAGWGRPRSDPNVDTAMAMAATAFCLDATQNALNHLLQMSGIDPVQISAGADHGEVCFVRIGTEEASEVNVVGHPANFAAKCEKRALSWEVVVGEGAADLIRDEYLTRHEDSPKRYEYGGQTMSYSYYQFHWKKIVSTAASAISQLSGTPTGEIDVEWMEAGR